MHRIMVDSGIPDTGQLLAIAGDEAVHAIRVKRTEPGEPIQIMDGAGVTAATVVEQVIKGSKRDGPTLEVRIRERTQVPFPGVRPHLEVWTATPKGGRVDDMIDQLSQVGAATWGPLDTERSVVDPREAKLARLERIARESAKQCGRPWVLQIAAKRTFADTIVRDPTHRAHIVIADATGEPWRGIEGAGIVRLLIGPEGGWTDGELAAARASGATIARFGVHTLRIETAAAVASGVIMSTSTIL